MHLRSPYSSPLSFAILAQHYPELSQYLVHNARTIDFQNPSAVRCLSAALLKVDWNLTVEFGGKIVPGVPSRLNYVLFIQDLLDATTPDIDTVGTTEACGLDIGTGASAIYPLLAVRSRPGWRMLATELDLTSVPVAQANVERNGLSGQINVVPTEVNETGEPKVIPDGRILEWMGGRLDFTMCNPPFFDSERGADGQMEVEKELPARAVCEATPFELQTRGGEVAFVRQMILESIELCGNTERACEVRWFTTLLGQKASVEPLVGLLREKDIRNYAISRLTTGQNWKGTVRWVLSWSFGDCRPPVEMARGGGVTMKPWWPEVGEFEIPGTSVPKIMALIDGLKGEPVKTRLRNGELWGWCEADFWSRKARRAKMRGEELRGGKNGVGWRIMRDEASGGVKICWREGRDRVLFESWAGWLKREVTKAD